VAAVKAEKDRLDAIKKTAENAIARMEERIVAAMQQFDRPKVEADTLKLSLRRSERVVVDDEAKVPADCKTIKVEVSKTELKRHLKAGEDCGAHIEENQSLQIK
jgi:capsid protein